MTKEKLLLEYKAKVSSKDVEIKSALASVSKARKIATKSPDNPEATAILEDEKHELSKLRHVRQAYYQFCCDLEDMD